MIKIFEINRKYRLFFKEQPYGWPRGATYFVESIDLHGTLSIRGYGLQPKISELEKVEVI